MEFTDERNNLMPVNRKRWLMIRSLIKLVKNIIRHLKFMKTEDSSLLGERVEHKVVSNCPCCNSHARLYKEIDGYSYYICSGCGLLFIDPRYIERIDGDGTEFSLVQYDEHYWTNELSSAKERSYGIALARMAEAFYYSRISINVFLDIGTGPGYFLDAVAKYLPNSKDVFYGIEKYPPPVEYQTKSINYVLTDYDTLPLKVDGGICIEVIEHLTPTVLRDILRKLAQVSNDEAFYIFNTGMPEFVLYENPGYLDPTKRGHIMSYSLNAVKTIASEFGFTTFKLKGKSWAFALEYKSKSQEGEDVQNRIWSATEHNLKILDDKDMGSVLKVLGLETSRAYNS